MSCRFLFLFLFIVLNTSVNAKWADRYYVKDVLLKNFGSKSEKIIEENILFNGQIFGGSCDFYEQIRASAKVYLNPSDRNCFKGKQEYAYKDAMDYNKQRQAFIVKACNAIVSCADCLNYFKVTNNLNINKNFVHDVLSSFYWNELLVKQLEVDYQKIFDRYFFESKKVKMLIFNVCIDPLWQKI
jgi:hypothetical protein